MNPVVLSIVLSLLLFLLFLSVGLASYRYPRMLSHTHIFGQTTSHPRIRWRHDRPIVREVPFLDGL